MSFEQEMGGALRPEEIAEAQALGILPKPQRAAPPIPASILPQTLAAQGGAPSPSPSPAPAQAARPRPSGPAILPRVQLDPAQAPSSPLSQSLTARREMYNRQLDEANKPPDYSKLQEQMRDRQAGAQDDMYASVLAGMGPEAVRGMQEPILKQSMAARQPMKVEGGMIDHEGRVMIDPAHQSAKKVDQLRNRLAQLDTLEAKIVSDADKAALAHERNQIMLMIKAMGASAAGGKEPKASTWGFAPDGRRIIEDQQGNQYVINPDNSRTPYSGPGQGKAAAEKGAGQVTNLEGNVKRSDALIELAKANAKAFGLTPALVAMTPDIVSSRVMPKVLNPDQLAARNYIQRQAAVEIHEIYGAALTMGEGRRAAGWAVNPGEGIDSVLSKLQAARDWAAQAKVNQGAAANAMATSRAGGQPQAPQMQLPSQDAIAAELARRQQQGR